MKRSTKQKFGQLVAVAVTLCCIAAAVLAVPHETLQRLGERAAQLSAGLRQPRDGMELLSGYMTRASAADRVPVTSPTVVLGSVQSHTVATTTTVVRKDGGGVILTQQMSAGSAFVQDVAIRNKSGKTVDVAKSLAHTPALGLQKNSDKPQVLIVHTHTTECYMSYDAGFYNPDDPSRTNDASKNMVAVGRQVAKQLEAAGIGVIHDTAIHDQPYNGAYGHSKAAIEAYLKQYPSIKVVLDLHRDAIYEDNTTYIKPTVEVAGKNAAQLMIIVGMLNSKTVPNTHTAENLAFGVRLQQRLHRTYPGLVRPLLLADARYNQQLTNGSLLIEVGSHANTLDEACYTAELLGGVLAEVLEDLGA